MANLSRLIQIIVKLVEADNNQFPALQKKLTDLGDAAARYSKAQEGGSRNAQKAINDLLKTLEAEEKAELKKAEALAKSIAKEEAAAQKRQERADREAAKETERVARREQQAAKEEQREQERQANKQAAAERQEAKEAERSAKRKQRTEEEARKEKEAAQQKQKAEAEADAAIDAALRRLSEVRTKGATEAKEEAKARGAAVQGEIVSIRALQEEIKVLTGLQKAANDAGARIEINNALRAVRAELDTARQPFKTFTEQVHEAANASRKIGVELGTTGLSKTLGEIKAKIAGLTGRSGLGAISEELGSIATEAGPAGVALGVVIGSLAGAKKAVDSTQQLASESLALAKALNITEREAAAIQTTFLQYGFSTEDARQAVGQLNGVLRDARDGSVEARQALFDYSVTEDQIAKGKLYEVLLQTAEGFEKYSGSVQKADSLNRLFQEQGAAQFAKLAGSLKNGTAEAEKFGRIFDKKAQAELAAYRKEIAELNLQIERLVIHIAKIAVKPLTEVFRTANDLIEFFFGGEAKIEEAGRQVGDSLVKGAQDAADKNPIKLKTEGGGFSGGIAISKGPVPGFAGTLPQESIEAEKAIIESRIRNGESAKELGKRLNELLDLQEKLKTQSAESKKVFDDLGIAYKTTTEQVFVYYKGNLEVAKAELEKVNAQRGSLQASQEQIEKLEKLRTTIDQATPKLAELREENEKLIQTTKDQNERLVEGGTRTRVQAAQAVLNVAKATAEEELTIAKQKFDAEQELYANDAERKKRSSQEYAEFVEAKEKEVFEFQKELNAAAAEERAKSYDKLSKALEDTEKDNVAKLEVALETGNEKYEDAARKRLQYTRDRINGELTELKKQQQAENVGAEEKIRLAEQAAAKERELRDANRGEEREVLEGKLKDIDTLATKENSELNLKKAKNAEFLEVRKKQGFDEIQLLELKIKLGKEELEQEIRNTRAQIDRLEAIKPGSAEVNDLTAHLNDLLKDQITFARESGEQLQAAYNKAAEAAEKAGDKAKEAADKVGDAAKRQLDGLAALYSTYANRVSDAAKLTEDQVEAGIKSLQDDLKGLSGVVPPEIAGLVGYFQSQTSKALQEAYKRRDEFDRQRREKEQEDARKAAEDAAKKADDIAKAEIEATKRAQETRRKALKDARQQEEKETKDHSDKLYEIGQDLLDGLAKARDEHAAKEEEKRKRRADEEVKAAQELAQRLAEAENSSEQNRLDKEEDFIKRGGKLRRERADLEKQLADEKARIAEEVTKLEQEAAAAEASGDRKKASDLRKQIGQVKAGSKEKDIQGKLDENSKEGETLAKQQEIQTRKNEEIQKALKAGYDKEKLDAVLKSIDDRYGAEEKYLADLLEAQKDGDELEQKQLKENYEKKQKALEEALKIEFDRIEADRAAKQKAREEEDAQDQKDYEDKKAELNERAEDARNQENARHQKELDDLKKHREEIRKEYQKSLDEIAEQTKQKLADAGLSVDALTAAYNRLNAAASKAQGAIAGAPGSGSQPSTPGSSSTSGPAGTTAPTTAGDGGNSRVTPPANTPPPSQPAPSPAPAGNNPPGGGSQPPKSSGAGAPSPGGITAVDPTLEQRIAAVRREMEAGYNATLNQVSELVLNRKTTAVVDLLTGAIAATQRNLDFTKKLKGEAGKKSFVQIQEDYLKKYNQLLADVLSGDFKVSSKNIDTTTGPDKTASTDTPGVTGGKPKVKDTSVGPDTKASTGPATVSDSSQPKKGERKPKVAQELVDRADVAKSADEAKEIFADAQKAKEAGDIDEDDFKRIKARLDNAAFQGGFINSFDTTKGASGAPGTGSKEPVSTPSTASVPAIPKGGSYGLSLRPGDYGRASEGLPRPIAPPVQKPPAADQLGGGGGGGNTILNVPDGLSAERIRKLEQYAKELNAQEQRARDAEVERMTRGLNG